MVTAALRRKGPTVTAGKTPTSRHRATSTSIGRRIQPGGSCGTRSSSVGGGGSNEVGGAYSTVAGGRKNTTGYQATVGGGYYNNASGDNSTIPGGIFNSATGSYSFAAGNSANATHDNSFVWGDYFGGGSAAADTFNVHASGGIYLNGSLEIASDRNLKKDFSFVSAREILDKVVELPIQTWRFKTEEDSISHIGPMSQDFMAAFGYGLDERYITSVDIDGVALAAVQGLNERLEEQLEVNTALRWHNAQIHSRNNALEARLARLEKAILREDEAAGSE